MNINPYFYGVATPEEAKVLRDGINRLARIIDPEAMSSPDGFNLDVWSTPTGAEVFPQTIPFSDFIVRAETAQDHPDRDVNPISAFYARGEDYVRFTIGSKDGDRRLNTFNIHFEPVSAKQYSDLKRKMDDSRHQERRSKST